MNCRFGEAKIARLSVIRVVVGGWRGVCASFSTGLNCVQAPNE